MEYACSEYNCSEEPAFYCNCKGTRDFCCRSHCESHKSLPGLHIFEPLVLKLNGQKRKVLTQILESYKIKLDEVRETYKIMSNKIIQEVLSHSTTVFEILQDVENNCASLAKKIVADEKVDHKTFEYFSRISVPKCENLMQSWESLMSILKNLFKFPSAENFPVPKSVTDQYIFYFDQNLKEFHKINLESLTIAKSPLIEDMRKNYFTGACKLDDGTYFLHGGINNHDAVSEALVFDIHYNKAVRVGKSHFQKNFSACVLKNNKIHVFGSTSPHSLRNEIFDLSTLSWSKLPPLPLKVSFCTASLVNGRILVTGTGIGSFWEFCSETYSFDLYPDEMSRGYKVLCENFIVTCDGLVEICYKDLELRVVKYPCFYIVGPLAIVMSKRFGKFLYYVDAKKNLMRIDTAGKKVEEVALA